MTDILTTVLRGMYASTKGFVMAFRIDRELRLEGEKPGNFRKSSVQTPSQTKKDKPGPTVLRSLGKSVGINVVFIILFALIFNYVLIPMIRYVMVDLRGLTGPEAETSFQKIEWFLINFGHAYYYPIVFITTVVNTIYHNDISKVTHKYTGGRAPPPGNKLTFTLSDFSYSVILHMLFYIQVLIVQGLLGSFPWTASIVKIILMSLGLSLAAFEYKWFDMSIPLSTRLYYVEKNWVYYVGFGLPWVLLDHHFIQIRYLSGALLRAFTPFLIVSAYLADPVDGNSPRLPVFYGVIFATNKIIAGIKVIWNSRAVTKKTPQAGPAAASHGQKSHSD